MRKFVAVATILFLLHTLEEATLGFWNGDIFTATIANLVLGNVETVYWISQMLLYLFLTFLLFAPSSRVKDWGYELLGIILLLEAEHIFVSLHSVRYEPGLISGIALTLFGVFFLAKTRHSLFYSLGI